MINEFLGFLSKNKLVMSRFYEYTVEKNQIKYNKILEQSIGLLIKVSNHILQEFSKDPT